MATSNGVAGSSTSEVAPPEIIDETRVSEIIPQKTVEKMSKNVLLSAMTWDIFSPPPTNSLKGKVVPRAVNRFKNRRKLSIEVHKITPITDEKVEEGKEPFSYEECVVRVLVPSTKEKQMEAKREGRSKLRKEKGSIETFTSIKDIEVIEDEEDDGSIGYVAEGALADTGGKQFDGYKAKYRIPVHAMKVSQHHKKSVFVFIEVGKLKQERELIFDTLQDAQKFCNKLEEESGFENTRSEKRLQAALGNIKLKPFENVALLVEIVSGWDLPVGDLNTSDPYVICMMGHREVHRTSYIPSTLDPIWTLKTGSLFLLTVQAKELFVNDGLNLLVKDYDKVGNNEVLGCVSIPPATLYKANGERMELKLRGAPGTKSQVPGYLAVRCRRATDYDRRFMEEYEKSSRPEPSVGAPAPAPNNAIRSIVGRNKKVDKDGIKRYKVRPSPDPQNVEKTEWLTHEEVLMEMMKPSGHWTDAGSGSLGRIYLEILGADGLPNLDSGGFLGNKTDAFVSVVYEDVYLRTEVIDDCLSPKWMPWTNRAFILNIQHPSSTISVGVFDFDAGPIDDHDLIGRFTIDVTNLRKDTEYVLKYNIYPSARVRLPGTERKDNGQVTVRLRLEIPDERKLVLGSLEPPENVYVNVKKKKDFRVVRQTCLGKYDVDQYSLGTFRSFIEELTEYKWVKFYIADALYSLLLWKGHMPIKIGSKEFMFPMHSLNAFIVATFLVENPQYYPSFCFASISWIMVATMDFRRGSPNVWATPWSYTDIMQKIIVGKSSTSPHKINPGDGYAETKKANDAWENRVQQAIEQEERDYEAALKAEEERLKELEEIGDVDGDYSTKVGGGLLDPIGSFLGPYQAMVVNICRGIRVVKNILIWDEAYFSFFVASACFVLAIVCMFIPWFFIIRWTARIIVWAIFGPWMKLVDVFYVSKMTEETDKDKKARQLKEDLEKRLATKEAKSAARLIRENKAKMKEMKKYMFGKYSMRVALIKEDRFVDYPLPDSYAVPHQQKALSLAELAMQEAGYNRKRLPGQNLVGDMIPTAETEAFTTAPTGKATANPDLLSRSVAGSSGKAKEDSTAGAYAKIGSMLFAASVLTFFGVPLLASFTEQVISKVPVDNVTDMDPALA